MYRCLSCRTRTDDIDSPNCEGHTFVPQKIPTVHQYARKDGRSVLLCTGKGRRPGAIAVGGRYGVTCIACKEAMNAKIEDKIESDLQETPSTDKIPQDQKTDQEP